MAGSFSLTDTGPSPTTVTLSPLADITPDHNVDQGTIQKISTTGKLFTYTKYTKINDRFKFNNISKANADVLNGWAQLRTTLTYVRDTDIPSATYSVKLINDGNPLFWMADVAPDTKFQGSLMIREI